MTDHPLADRIEKLIQEWRGEVRGYVAGSMLPSPVGEMNRASADVVRRMIKQLEQALAPVLPPVAEPEPE